MNKPRVIVIMPVYNESRHLQRVLESIAAQTFDRSRMYMLAVDGNSGDGTREILQTWFEQTRMPGCVVVNPRRRIPTSLNLGLRYAGAEDIVVRLDAHTIYGPTYISEAVETLETAGEGVGCVGSAYIPLPATALSERIVQALYTNRMSLGGAGYRFGNDLREADSVYLGAWRASVLIEAGGFNETLEAGEDAEMAARIRKSGLRILRAPLPCRFMINRGVLATLRQWHRYGYWRTKMLRANPHAIRARHVVAPAAALSSVLIACSPLRIVLVPAFLAYILLVYRAREKGEPLGITLLTFFYFPAVQIAFVAGMLRSLPAGNRPAEG